MTAEQAEQIVFVLCVWAIAQGAGMVIIWSCVVGLRSYLQLLDRQDDKMVDRMRDIREELRDISNDLSEMKRIAVARDKMLRAAAGVEVKVQ